LKIRRLRPFGEKRHMRTGSQFQRVVAVGLVFVLVAGSTPALAAQGAGTIAGKATDEAKKPYSDYVVQLRDVATGLVVNTQGLDTQGQFSFVQVAVPQTYLVELVQAQQKKIVCTEGPYSLTIKEPGKLDVNINCGKAPAALWLLAAGAGAAVAIAISKRSASK
jgi:hypothetical protein